MEFSIPHCQLLNFDYRCWITLATQSNLIFFDCKLIYQTFGMVADFFLRKGLKPILRKIEFEWHHFQEHTYYTHEITLRKVMKSRRKNERERKKKPCNKSSSCTHYNVANAWPNVKQGDNRYLQKENTKNRYAWLHPTENCSRRMYGRIYVTGEIAYLSINIYYIYMKNIHSKLS